MKTLMIDNFKVLKYLLGQDQKNAKKVMDFFLDEEYKQVVKTKDYTYAIGEIPIALVAHLDTVYPFPAKEIFHDQEQDVIWSPDGLGADDRAGLFAIIQIVRSGLKPHIILTTDEEKGGLGARALVKAGDCPFKELKYMIELDRHGKEDCVFYDTDNPVFTKYIESFGFKNAWGSFSDISELAPAWKTCAVNLSVGYYDEHSYGEHLRLQELQGTIDKVCVMLKEKAIPDFEYIEMDYLSFIKCGHCGRYFTEYELFPVKTSGDKFVNLCPDCMVGHVGWCYQCNDAFWITDQNNKTLCSDCLKEVAANV